MTYNEIANKIVNNDSTVEITVYDDNNIKLFKVYPEKDREFSNVYHMTIKISGITGKVYGLCTIEEISNAISELDNLTATVITRFGKKPIKALLEKAERRAKAMSETNSSVEV